MRYVFVSVFVLIFFMLLAVWKTRRSKEGENSEDFRAEIAKLKAKAELAVNELVRGFQETLESRAGLNFQQRYIVEASEPFGQSEPVPDIWVTVTAKGGKFHCRIDYRQSRRKGLYIKTLCFALETAFKAKGIEVEIADTPSFYRSRGS